MRFERRILVRLAVYVSSFPLEGVLYAVLRRDCRAGYAVPRSLSELSSGVMDGRERRQGVMASWKTEARFVRRRMSDPLSWMGLRSCLRRLQPFVLKAMLLSSIKDRIAGTSRGKCASRCVLSAG